MIKKCYRYLLGLETYKLFVLLFVILIASTILIGLVEMFILNHIPSNTEKISLIKENFFSRFFSAVIITPPLETAIFQVFLIYATRTYIRNNLICVIISGVLFASIHFVDVGSTIVIFFAGICLGLFYTILKRQRLNAFWLTSLFHSTWNLMMLSLIYFV